MHHETHPIHINHGLYLTDEIRQVLYGKPPPALVFNVSGGKDSELTLSLLLRLVADYPIYFVFADTGMEWEEKPGRWPSTEDWVRSRVASYGHQMTTVKHEKETYPDRIRRWRKFPSPGQRWCTSDFKQGPIEKFIRRLPHDVIINVLGIRAAESANRAGYPPWALDEALTVAKSPFTGRPRTVYTWYPVFHWPTADVFSYLRARQIPLHPVYNFLGRLSCRVCIYQSPRDLAAIMDNAPEVLQEVADLEQEIAFTMKSKKNVIELAAGYKNKQILDDSRPGQLCLF